jgi:hypothetical protein
MKTILAALAALAIAASATASLRGTGLGVVDGGSWAGAHFDFFAEVPTNPHLANYFHFSDQGMFIPVDVVVPSLSRIAFGRASVDFFGFGTMNGSTPVMVFVHAVDGGNSDSLQMFVYHMNGQLAHSANGAVIEGRIIITVTR